MMWGYIISFVLGFMFHKALPDLRKRFFVVINNYFNGKMDPKMKTFRKKALAEVKNVKSGLAELQKTGAIRILEIGVGTGTNFQHYPAGCQLVVVDPNPHFKSYYDNNRAKFPQIKSEEIIVGYGENMDMVADNSVDVVVITLVLCSVNNIKKILKEVLRVLVPGGKFFFLEHVREWDGEKQGTKQFLQDMLTKTGIWPGLFDGCELNREPHLAIDSAGFSEVQMEKITSPSKCQNPIFLLVNSTLVGVATK